ncbi:daptide-type RiPP biosynthesis methyltransferase [Lentzea sp. NPDC051213]|uniref:daptide-type RiPP biosynthesis methyltransferase n=1 Tax=Lentzea sp. NPDC051213 TaxID=3364126 RepID=UPI0037B9EBA1
MNRSNIPGTAGQVAALFGLPAKPLYGKEGAPVYDAIARHDPSEIRDVLRLARGPVLELACGSGRLTVPLAARGHEVVALDNSAALLGMLADRLPAGADVRLVEGDMTAFELHRRFGLVVLGTSSVCLLDTSQRAELFACVRRHLAGVFYVSVLDFAGLLLARQAERSTVVVQDQSMITLFQHFDGRRGVRTTSLLQESADHRALYTSEVRMVSSEQLAEELAAAGFKILERRRGLDSEQVQVQLICGRHDD